MRSPGYAAARQRLIAYRYTRDTRPRVRVRVRVDPIVRRSAQILTAGLVTAGLGLLLRPPPDV